MDIAIHSYRSPIGITKEVKINSHLRVLLSLSLLGAKKSEIDFIISTITSSVEVLSDIESFDDLVKEFNKILDKGNYDKNLNLVLFGFENDTLHISQYGDIIVSLYRKEKLSQIVKETKKDSIELKFISSGNIKQKDVILITHGLSNIPENKDSLNSLLKKNETLYEALDEIKDNNYLKESGLTYVSLLEFKNDEEEVNQEYFETKKQTNELFKKIKIDTNPKEILSKFWESTSSFLSKMKNKIPETHLNENETLKKISGNINSDKIKNLFDKNRLIFIPIIIFLVILFAGSLYYSSVQRDKQIELERFEILLKDVKSELEQAKRFVSTQNKIQAKQYLENVYIKSNQIKDAGYFIKDITDLLKEINEQQELLDNITYIKNPQHIYENSSESSFKLLEVVDKDLFVITDTKVIGPLFLADNQTPNIVDIPNNEVVVDTSPFNANKSILVLTNTNSIYEIKNGIIQKLKNAEQGDSKFTDIEGYGTRNKIYLLAPSENNVFSFTKISDKLNRKETYNVPEIDIKNSVSIAIDGNIYKLLKNGDVERSYAKKPIPLDMVSGPTIPMNNLKGNSKMFTNENLRNVYILDTNNNRVLVYKKEPFENTRRFVYERMYKSNENTFNDIWVDNEEANIYFVDNQHLYKYSLTAKNSLLPENVKIE